MFILFINKKIYTKLYQNFFNLFFEFFMMKNYILNYSN